MYLLPNSGVNSLVYAWDVVAVEGQKKYGIYSKVIASDVYSSGVFRHLSLISDGKMR